MRKRVRVIVHHPHYGPLRGTRIGTNEDGRDVVLIDGYAASDSFPRQWVEVVKK